MKNISRMKSFGIWVIVFLISMFFTDINLIQVLHDNFIAIEQLESEANNMKIKLSKLHNDTWEIIEKLQKRIGEI